MSYIQNGTIEYGDVNKFATGSATGTTPDPALVNINSLWGIGSGNIGYGQTTDLLPNVTQDNSIKASDWIPLTALLNKIAKHQNILITVPNDSALPALNSTITYQDYTTRLNSQWSNRLNTVTTTSSTILTTTHTVTSWTSAISPVFTITFASGDHARYFFNCGGRIRIFFTMTGYSASNIIAVAAAAAVTATGYLYISSPADAYTSNTSGAGIFTGFTQQTTGSVATRTVYDTATGYYGLTTTNKTLYTMNSSATNSRVNISLSARTNGVQGSNGDNGNVITVSPKWTATTTPSTATTGTFTTRCALMFPETTYLANSWGTPTVTVV